MIKRLIVGLGNPGEQYQETRHNIGFMALNSLSELLDLHEKPQKQIKLKSRLLLVSEYQACLAYPQTFMNESGQAVQALLHWFKISDLSDLVVVHDDVSLPLGQLRWSVGRGAGGQHGIESIIQSLGGSRDFIRLRIGIGPDPGGEERARYVLSVFRSEEILPKAKILTLSAEALAKWLRGQAIDKLMSEYNAVSLSNPSTPERPKRVG